MKAPQSLKARALQLLAQRDQSRIELRRKLLRQARRSAAAQAGADGGDAPDPSPDVEAVLAWLDEHGLLSDARFVESRVHAREARFGNLRIRQELAQHGLAAPAELVQSLRDSELERARAVREKRFASVPQSAAERAAQSRFLAGRGFSPETIQRLMRRPG